MMQPPRQIERDRAEIEVPAVRLAGRRHDREALRHRRRPWRPAGCRAATSMKPLRSPSKRAPGAASSCAARTRSSFSIDRLRAPTAAAMHGRRRAQLQRRRDGPGAGALLRRAIEDDLEHRLAGLGIGLAEDVGRDLDQVRVELAAVPLGEDRLHLGDSSGPARPSSRRRSRRSAACRHTRCRCAASSRSGRRRRDRYGAAGLAVDLRGDRLEDRPDPAHRPRAAPPGMIEGRAARLPRRPKRRCRRRAGRARAGVRSRRMVSVKRALPPSMMMSPGSSSGRQLVDLAIVASPALTIRMIARGLRTAPTRSSSVVQGTSGRPVASSLATNSSVRLGVRLKTATVGRGRPC